MDIAPTTHLSLCSGYGGIDLGLRRAIPNLRTVAYAEIEAFAVENLLARMEGGSLDAAPIWPDLKTFHWESFRDRVDILSGGYPCQPFSSVGKRLGTDDPRHLWPYIAAGIRLLRPRMCFFENVEGHVSLGLREVVGELEQMGFKVSWGIFSASEVGAPHQRKRVFILAHRIDKGSQGWLRRWQDSGRKGEHGHAGCGCGSAGVLNKWPSRPGELANAMRERRQQIARSASCHEEADGREGRNAQQPHSNNIIECNGEVSAWPSRPGQPQHAWEPPRVVGNTQSRLSGIETEREGREDFGGGSPKAGRQTLDDTQERLLRDDSDNQRQTVGESDTANDSGSCSGELSWIYQSTSEGGVANHLCRGLQDTSNKQRYNGTDNHASIGTRPTESSRWQTQPPLGGDIDGTASGLDYAELCEACDNRTDELRLLGNGVVPATATLAFHTLLDELLIAEILR